MELQPDQPFAFGHKMAWFAIRTKDCEAVADALGLTDRRPANWAMGIDAVYKYASFPPDPTLIFVAPPVEGWTLAIGSGFPPPADLSERVEHLHRGLEFRRLFRRLGARFDDVQFFASHRGADYFAWARARAGQIERLYSFADGGVSSNAGKQTVEEARLGFLDLNDRSPFEASEYLWQIYEEAKVGEDRASPGATRLRIVPDENDVTDLAGEWSIDPTKIASIRAEARLGLLGLTPRPT